MEPGCFTNLANDIPVLTYTEMGVVIPKTDLKKLTTDNHIQVKRTDI
jgi:hypothetical protein